MEPGGTAFKDSSRTRALWILALPLLWFSTPTAEFLVAGGALAALGLAIRAWAAGTVFKNRQLAITGPYAFVRHPLYVGSFLLGIGVAAAAGHWVWPASFLLFYWRTYGATVRREEAHLERLFGEDYRRYRLKAPAFVPRLRPWRQAESGGGFSMAQYAGNGEWRALLGALAVFALLAGKAAFGFALP